MQVITLPQAFQLSPDVSIQLVDYRSWESQARSKINLAKNVFSFLVEGTKEVAGDQRMATIENDSFLLLKAGHCLMTETVSSEQNTYRSMLLFFRDEDLLDVLEKSKTPIPPRTEVESFRVCAYDAYTRHFVKGLAGLLQLDPAQQSQLLKIKFEEIMTYLVQRDGDAFVASILHAKDDPVIRFKRVIESNRYTKLTLAELAFLCNMSLSTFKREFGKYYPSPPSRWFQERRLEHAAYQLKSKQLRASELFEDAGYDSLSNFIQAFKKMFGKTPKQYQMED